MTDYSDDRFPKNERTTSVRLLNSILISKRHAKGPVMNEWLIGLH